jgi:two-component system cell cycle response regulator
LSASSSNTYSKADEQFLERLNKAISRNIKNADLNVDQLAVIMNMSRATLYRKIKEISNFSSNELVNIARLKMAAEILANDEDRVYEIYSKVGFSSKEQFVKNFTKQFGISPSEYKSMKKEERKNKKGTS